METNGWVYCDQGHEHWGRAGAAGLFLTAMVDGELSVLLQHRSAGVDCGNTWGIVGGALDLDESPVAGALREFGEEVDGLGEIMVYDTFTDDHGGWGYTTVVAETTVFDATVSEGDSKWETGAAGFAWVPVAHLNTVRLHPHFAASLSEVTALLRPTRVLVSA